MLRRRFLTLAGAAPWSLAQPLPRLEPVPAAAPVAPSRDTGRFAGKRWKLQHLYDDDRWSATLADLCCPAAGSAIAALWLESGSRRRSAALVTRDPGASWTEVPLKDTPRSLFALDENHVWMAGEKSLWFSAEAGYAWNRIPLPKTPRNRPVFRVHFLDARTGWAFGAGRAFYATSDGGASWAAVPQAAELQLRDENTVWTSMAFLDGRHGLIVGFSDPRRGEESALPDWMLPERAARRRLVPVTTVAGEARDGGASWKFSVASAFGRAVRLCASGDRGLAIYHYSENFAFPSEVYALDFHTGSSRPVFRRRDLWVHDAALLPDGTAILAATQPAGGLLSSPVPGKLRMMYSADLENWAEMHVDYRAEGHRALLAAPAGGELWAATDAGCILRLL